MIFPKRFKPEPVFLNFGPALFGDSPDKEVLHDTPLLYHLEHDPAEKYDIAENHHEILDDIRQEVERHRRSLVPVKNQLDERI